MDETIICQRRILKQSNISWLQTIVHEHPKWSRNKITNYICSQWSWHTPKGQKKTFAARSLIDKLEQRGYLKLPPVRIAYQRAHRPPFQKGFVAPVNNPIAELLSDITPLSIHIPEANSFEDNCVGYYLSHYHYLGFNRTVGENLKFLISDQYGRDLGCLLFDSAAWKTSPRDAFIGWTKKIREDNINFITNNSRFLLLPWVRVPHLASYILARVVRRIKKDWVNKYAHPIHLVETFVQHDRFRGTCYKASNWLYIGQTKGRSRQDQYYNLCVPVKDIYLYPLTRNFRQILCRGNS